MDFDELGGSCAHPECGKRDFLPITCNACKKQYCDEHFKYWAHNCPQWSIIEARERRIFDCPICKETISLISFKNGKEVRIEPNEAWNQHFESGNCNRKNKKKKKKKKKKCQVCSKELNLTNKTQCKACQVWTCLEHRFPEAHQCNERKRALRVQTYTKSQTCNPKNKVTKKRTKPVKRPTTTQTTLNFTNAQGTRSKPNFSCILCGQGFGTESGLARHFSQVHDHQTSSSSTQSSNPRASQSTNRSVLSTAAANNRNRGNNQGGNEICPQCGLRFSSVVDLIEHVERKHGQQSKEKCTVN